MEIVRQVVKIRILARAAFAAFACVGSVWAGPKVTIIGDSYSTFAGTMPKGYAAWYTGKNNGVTSVGHTYWKQVIDRLGGTLEVNNAWSGSCLSFPAADGTRSMIDSVRLGNLGDPDLILVCGGTNDSWAWHTVGEPAYHDNLAAYTSDEKHQVSGALCYLLKWLAVNKPKAEVVVVSNSYDDFDLTAYHGRPGVREEICLKQKAIAAHYGALHVQCSGIEKASFHPTAVGFATMSGQIVAAYEAARPVLSAAPAAERKDGARIRVTVKELGTDAASATVAWCLSEDGGDFSGWTTLTASATKGWDETIALTGLAPDTKFTLRVRAVNDLNRATTAECPFATHGDGTAVLVVLAASAVGPVIRG